MLLIDLLELKRVVVERGRTPQEIANGDSAAGIITSYGVELSGG